MAACNQSLKGKPLSKREVQIIEYIIEGDTNKEIAYKLGISEVTVKNHVWGFMQKLDAKNRTHAVVIYCDLMRKPSDLPQDRAQLLNALLDVFATHYGWEEEHESKP